MQYRVVKFSIFAFIMVVFVVRLLDATGIEASSNRPPSRNTAAPGESNCSSCHGGSAVNSGGGTLALVGLPSNYMPNQSIPLTVRITQNGRPGFGFQVTAIDDMGRQAGNIVVTDTARTALMTGTVGSNTRQYIGQTTAGTAATASGQGSWNFTWTAPAQSAGRVTFYVASVAANANGDTSGDSVYSINQSIQPGAAVGPLANTSAASYAANGMLTSQTIASAWGTGLSQNSIAASSTPLPTQLDGTQVMVRDSMNRESAAGLFWVSPGQVNYLVPQTIANGAATVTILRNGQPVAQGPATINNVAPGLFTANASGSGVAAAVILRVRNGVGTYENVAQFNAQAQRFDPLQIDLGPQTDQVYLILFGTGFRNLPMQSAATANIGGTASTVVFAGAQGMLLGLDQANILLPRSLAGRGLLNVILNVSGVASNTVQINVR